MSVRNFQTSVLPLLVCASLTSTSAFAAGYEKALSWSAESSAQAGAVVSTVDGAESVYFNPAGLSNSTSAGEVSLNFSPTFSKFHGANPFQNYGTSTAGSVDGKGGFSPVAGIVGSFKPTERLGVGVGYFVSGGTKSKYEGLNYANVSAGAPYTLAPTVETDLAITEASVGLGYEVMPGLRVGAAWRAVMVNADFSTVGVSALAGNNPTAAITNVAISDIEAKRYNAYRLGVQYENSNRTWGVGANYRSQVKFIAKGTTGGSVDTAAATAPTALTAGTADLENMFPQQAVLGGYVKVTPMLRISPEYSFTNYSENKTLAIRGTVNGSALSNIGQNWKNQHVGRLGFEYTGMGNMPLRFGYAYTSQVTPSERARSTFASPGAGHSIAAGTGMAFGGNIEVDLAGEYSWAKGKGLNSPEVTTEQEFKSRAIVGHLSAKYRF